MYFTIANIDPAQRSKLDAVHLIALFECDLFSRYTIDDILAPFFDDLEKLSQVCMSLINIALWLAIIVIHSLAWWLSF